MHNKFCGIKLRTPTFDFSDTLHELETFIYLFDVDCIMLVGDLNVDFMQNNAHSNYLRSFCHSLNLTNCSTTASVIYIYMLMY